MRKQRFKNKFTLNVNEGEILKARNNDALKDSEICMCEYLYTNIFATQNQINTFLNSKGYKDLPFKRLSDLCTIRIINKFVLCDPEQTHNLDDEDKVIYCLDLGGKHLLNSYSDIKVSSWMTNRNYMGANQVEDIIILNEFHKELLEILGDRLVGFTLMNKRNYRNNQICIDVEFGVRCDIDEQDIQYYIGSFIKDSDTSNNIAQKIHEVCKFIFTDTWKKYCFGSEKPPHCLFISPTKDLSYKLNKHIYYAYDLDTINHSYISIENLSEDINNKLSIMECMS